MCSVFSTPLRLPPARFAASLLPDKGMGGYAFGECDV
jgi:hypothetical protein